jgi:hypothetical protein
MSYGYDDSKGKLELQQPARPGFSGLPGDTVGPSDYTPKIAFAEGPGAFFGRGATRKTGPEVNENSSTPGPGYYSLPSSFNNYEKSFFAEGNYLMRRDQARSKMDPSFRSESKRELLPRNVLKNPVPGPGVYTDPNSISATAQKLAASERAAPDKQCFGASEKRFRPEQARSNQNMVPPGAYTPLTSDFDVNKIKILKSNRMKARSDWGRSVSFTTSGARFRADKEGIGPSPGDYVPKTAISDDLRRSMKKRGKSVPFYNTTERFKEEVIKPHASVAGSGSQDELLRLDNKLLEQDSFAPFTELRFRNGKNSKPLAKSFPFASSVQRIPGTKEQTGPNPMAYDTNPRWDGPVPHIKPSTKPKVKKQPDISPGPGIYVVDKYGLSAPPSKRRNPKNIMISTSRRAEGEMFKPKEGPGPGIYNLSTSMITPSHNVMLSGEF